MIKLAAAVAILLLPVLAPQASAQGRPQTREGFTIAFGLGGGSAGITCDGCNNDRKNGGTGFLRIGGAVNPNLIISGQMRGWSKEEGGATTTFGFLLAGAQWYPQTATGFYLEGGLGLGSTSFDDGTDELTSAGMAISLGTGYDIRVRKNFSLTPFVNYASTFGAEAKLNGNASPLVSGNLNGNVVQLGLGFTWH